MRYIPKIIHLVWFGKNPYPKIVERCIDSWREYCNEYEIRIWNEDSFDINSSLFVKEAFESKKWAFVSDYVRLYALYTVGGVYIDSDVELLRPIDELLENEYAVTGYEDKMWIPAAVMAAVKNNVWIGTLLDYYNNRHFVKSNGTLDMKANMIIITEISKRLFNFKVGDSFIKNGNVKLYPTDVFQPYKREVFDLNDDGCISNIYDFYVITNNTYAIHHNTTTWVDNKKNTVAHIKHSLRKYLPKYIFEKIRELYYKLKIKNVD